MFINYQTIEIQKSMRKVAGFATLCLIPQFVIIPWYIYCIWNYGFFAVSTLLILTAVLILGIGAWVTIWYWSLLYEAHDKIVKENSNPWRV